MTDPSFSLQSMGYNDRWIALMGEVKNTEAVPGRVIRRDRGWAVVATGQAHVSVEIANLSEEIVTGDWVALTAERVIEILPRKGALRRSGFNGVEQLMAANVDVVLLVCGLDRPVKPGRVHRGAIQAWDAGAEPVVVLNKADLCENPSAAADSITAQTQGLDILMVSARTGVGVEAVRDVIRGRTAVVLGESGAGKSSLLNALAGESLAVEGAVREGDFKGRHTTTRRELHLLPNSGVIIDTPGIRSFGLAATSEAIESAFDDVETLARSCRFNDCGHSNEPGCAVRGAMERGDLHMDRLQAYLELRDELAGQVLRTRPHDKRRREKKMGRLAEEGQRAKQGRL